MDWHCAFDTVAPLDDVLPPVLVPDEDVDPDELEPEELDDPPWPVPVVVELQAVNAARTTTSASVDFIPDRVPC